jgi:glyoxylase-like metal-dependent hydrolase (beta-lactamase superfamily II)
MMERYGAGSADTVISVTPPTDGLNPPRCTTVPRVTDWFATRPLDDGVFLIAEPFHVNSFLVEGSDERVHLDTGLGIADIRAAGDALSDRPASAANTHHHFDHVGGNTLFERIAIHELGVALLAQDVPERWLDEYRGWASRMYEAWSSYRRYDEDFFALTDDASTLRPWPDGFDLAAWRIAGSVATRALSDGDVLELGRRRLRTIHTPGHTLDSVCFLDEDRGILFCGDTVNSGPILANDDTADIEAFARSTRRLAEEIRPAVRVLYMAHGARFTAEPRYLQEVADGFQTVAEGSVAPERTVDAYSGVSRVARFPRFSIVLPG